MEPNADRETLLVPVGTRLVHIGPSKTGTTSLQAAMWAARDEMRAQGVRYAAAAPTMPSRPRGALAGVNSPASDEGAPPPIRLWKDLVGDIRQAREPRLILSSEFLAHAQPDGIRRLVDDLDPARVRVAVTLRPIARILASQWQQTVQAGRTTSFDAWLDALFNRPDGKRRAAIWHRHRHDRLIARWAEVVGVDRMTVVVVDDRDHEQVLRAFEALLGCGRGPRAAVEPRQPVPDRRRGRALPRLQRVVLGGEARRPMHNDLVRLGAATHMKTRLPGPDEARIETPQWALDRAGEVAREMVAAIAASGVRVVGDLDRLTEVPVNGRRADARPVPVEAAPDVAASLSLGLVVAAGLARGARPAADAGGPSDVDLTRVTSRHLVKVVYGRMDTMARVRLRAARRRVVAAGSR
jgi:hypothetical protein